MRNHTLTLLFTDIVGSTELFGALESSARERLRAGHLSLLGDEVERHGGCVIKTLGDGIMASFGAAGAAIEAAVAIQQRTAIEAQRSPSTALSIRVGISSGDVFQEGADCFGNAVVEASRLCAHALAGQILLAENARLLASTRRPLLELGELRLKGLPEPTIAWEAAWSPMSPAEVRAVLADDSLLVREGIARVLGAHGIEVLAEAGDPSQLAAAVAEWRPDIAIVDVRMPPTHTLEGVEAAERIIARYPHTAILLLSQDVQPQHVARLLEARPSGIGYLLKERVTDTREFAETVRRVAAGETAFEAGTALDRSDAEPPREPRMTGAVS